MEYEIFLARNRPFWNQTFSKSGLSRLPQYLQFLYIIRTGDYVEDKYYGDYYEISRQEEDPNEDDFRIMIFDNLQYLYKMEEMDGNEGEADEEAVSSWIDFYHDERDYGLRHQHTDEYPPLDAWMVSRLRDEIFKDGDNTRAAAVSDYVLTFNDKDNEYLCNSQYTNDFTMIGHPENVEVLADGRYTWNDNVFIKFSQDKQGAMKVNGYYTRCCTLSNWKAELLNYIELYTPEIIGVINDKADGFKWWEDLDFLESQMANNDWTGQNFLDWFMINYQDEEMLYDIKDGDFEEMMINFHTDFETSYLRLPEYGLGFFIFIDDLFKANGTDSEVETPLGTMKAFQYDPDDEDDRGNAYWFKPDKNYLQEGDAINLDYTKDDLLDEEPDDDLKVTDDFPWLTETLRKKTKYRGATLRKLKKPNWSSLSDTHGVIVENGCWFRKDTEYILSKEGLFASGDEDLVRFKYKDNEQVADLENQDKNWYNYYYPDQYGIDERKIKKIEFLEKEDWDIL